MQSAKVTRNNAPAFSQAEVGEITATVRQELRELTRLWTDCVKAFKDHQAGKSTHADILVAAQTAQTAAASILEGARERISAAESRLVGKPGPDYEGRLILLLGSASHNATWYARQAMAEMAERFSPPEERSGIEYRLLAEASSTYEGFFYMWKALVDVIMFMGMLTHETVPTTGA